MSVAEEIARALVRLVLDIVSHEMAKEMLSEESVRRINAEVDKMVEEKFGKE
jgi:hypothetical protein